MIKAHCHTNLDAYQRETWPNLFYAIPNIGDRIESKSGKILKVVSVTHGMTWDRGSGPRVEPTPTIEIELHKGVGG